MSNQNKFIFYTQWFEQINILSPEQIKELFKAINNYFIEGNNEIKDQAISIVFSMIVAQIQRDNIKYDETIRKRNQINGSKGGRPRKEEKIIGDNRITQNNPDNPVGLLETQKTLNKNINIYKNKDKEEDIICPVLVNPTDESPAVIKNRELKKQATELLLTLNKYAGTEFRICDTNLDLIIARLKDSSYKEVEAVIGNRINAWRKDEKMCKYLRPETLFRKSKFESYLAEAKKDREFNL